MFEDEFDMENNRLKKTKRIKKQINLPRVLGMLCLAAAMLLVMYNFVQDYRGSLTAEQYGNQLESSIERGCNNSSYAALPEYVLNQDMPMPEITENGFAYIGLLKIDTLDLELPIISHWSYKALKIAPARYTGSVYRDNMVIAAHNYKSHFGNLKKLQKGDIVHFTDVNGNCFEYQVSEIDILKPTETAAMESGNWDMTLFTCTVGGASRVTVRCEKII